jgi:acyl-CoA reductase-like NAD-dependent aldehyde dehydrogenase
MAQRFAPPPEISTAFIDNAILPPAAGRRLAIVDPATEQRVGFVEEADAGVVDKVVSAARLALAQGPWPRMAAEARQEILRRIASLIEEHAEELAFLECLNSGIPMRHLALGQIPRAALNFRFFADYIGQSSGQTFSQNPQFLTLVTREPIGVAGLIGPWNAPLALLSMKIAGCIAFGNCCVAKPAEQTPLALARFMSLIAQSGLPPGVVNLVHGTGQVTGEALVRHPGVDLISFTGGTQTGRKIMAAAGEGLKGTSLELGGKSANIVFDTADYDRALDAALLSIFSNNGQQCLAGSRILVQRSISRRFIDDFVARARALRLGDPMSPATEMGPLAFAAHLDRVLSFVEVARADGGQLLTGGERARGFAAGYYMAPTVVLAPSNAARIAQEEVFGPFATFIVFDTVDEAIAIANQSRFGLVCYVWSQHLQTVMQAIGGIEAGTVWVNTPMARELHAPFGGVKQSGPGREGGAASEAFYTSQKTSMIPRSTVSMTRLGLGGAG